MKTTKNIIQVGINKKLRYHTKEFEQELKTENINRLMNWRREMKVTNNKNHYKEIHQNIGRKIKDKKISYERVLRK